MKNVNIKTYIAIVLFAYVLYCIQDILPPFILGASFAFILDPMVSYFVVGRNRGIYSAVAVLVFGSAVFFLLLILGEWLQNEARAIIGMAFVYFEHLAHTHAKILEFYKLSSLSSWIDNIILRVISHSLSVTNIVSLIILTPITTFYFLRDWSAIINSIYELVPERFRKTLSSQCSSIQASLYQYLKGQSLTCIVLAIFYSTFLTIIGFKQSIVIGIMTGLSAFFPYLGVLFWFCIAIILSLKEFGSCYGIVFVYSIGQFIEGNLLYPQLIGKKLGFHPLWLLFSLITGFQLFGIWGVLSAIPVAICLRVAIRLLLANYWVSI